MKKTAIICDSSVSFSPEQIRHYDVIIAPLTLIVNNTEYLDQITMTQDQVFRYLENKTKILTSQPNLGTIINLYKKTLEEGYDQICVLSLSSALSGTYNAFVQAKNELDTNNILVFDTGTLGGPVQQGVKLLRNLDSNASLELMNDVLTEFFMQTESFVFPKTLDQLKVSGRISGAAATFASLLKIKPLLHLATFGKTIEKYDAFRTESRVFSSIIQRLHEQKIDKDSFDLYFLHARELDTVNRFIEYLKKNDLTYTYYIASLPAAVSTHAGLGTVAIQWIPKIRK